MQTLYTYPENFRAYKALVAAQYAGSSIIIAPNFVFGETNKQDAFLKKFPAGKVSQYLPLYFDIEPSCHTGTKIGYVYVTHGLSNSKNRLYCTESNCCTQ